MPDTSLGVPASDFYTQQSGNRTGVVNAGRRIADLTIPSVFPHEAYDASHDDLPITNQGINAALVNSLSNTLALTAFPPNLPMLKFSPVESMLAGDIAADPELWGEIEYGLSRKEEAHRKKLNVTRVRDRYQACMKLLIAGGGNGCVLWTQLENPILFNLHSYVVLRDSRGVPLVTVIKETIKLKTADEDVKEAVVRHRVSTKKAVDPEDWEEEADIYHVQKLVENRWLYWQETEGGHVIADTWFWSDWDTPAIYPAFMILDTGNNYAISYCSDYEGDLRATETLSAAFQDGAAALAWFLLFVNPTGQTTIKSVREADNLDVIAGRAEDVTTFQTGKGADVGTVSNGIEQIARRLAIAFASEAGIQRQGERVTAEEWKRMALALDKGMGGLYAMISQTVQRWFVLRFLFLHHKADKSLKELPKEYFEVEVSTGIDAIGRATEYDNLLGWAQDMSGVLTPPEFAKEINRADLLRRTAAGRGIKTDGLVKSEAQKNQEAQDQTADMQQQTLLEKGATPIAKGGMDMLAGMMTQGDAPNGGQ